MDMTGVAPMTERLTMGSYRLPIGVDTSRLFIKIEELHEVRVGDRLPKTQGLKRGKWARKGLGLP
jgi:hypothetical protein